jgi:hypothetical protein
MAATHQRTIIRKAIIARLAGATRAEARVFDSKTSPWRANQLPGISVETLHDPVDSDSRLTAPRIYRRNLEVKIWCVLQLASDVSDGLDAFELEVRRVLDADTALKDEAGEPQACDVVLVGSECGFDREADQPIGALALTFAVPYDEPSPDAADHPLDDFETASIETSLGGAQAPADRAHDSVTLETDP